MYSPAAMYAAAGYPGYIGYPVQYYPYYPASAAAAMQPSIQPLRPTIMIPVNINSILYKFNLSIKPLISCYVV